MNERKGADGPNADQAALWNGQGGETWVELQERLDAGMRPVTELLMTEAAPGAGETVLDVGCGAGETTLALAAAVGPSGRAVGLDISAPLVERARARVTPALAGRTEFRLGDAQDEALEAGRYDLVVSRFGVMFFADPVAAFCNLAQALRPGGRIVFVTWAPIEHNPWFGILREAAEARLGRSSPPAPGAPGPFAFADAGGVLGILAEAGLSEARVRTVPVRLWQAATPGDAGAYALRLGPSAALMRERNGTAEDAAAIGEAVAAWVALYAGPDGVVLPASVHVFTAARPVPEG